MEERRRTRTTRAKQPVVKVWRRTETGEAPAGRRDDLNWLGVQILLRAVQIFNDVNRHPTDAGTVRLLRNVTDSYVASDFSRTTECSNPAKAGSHVRGAGHALQGSLQGVPHSHAHT